MTDSSIPQDQPILVINSGSSSLKFGVYTRSKGDEAILLSGSAEGIAGPEGRFRLKDGAGQTLVDRAADFASSRAALAEAATTLGALRIADPAAIGHRIVHGGPRLRDHQRITPEVVRVLEESVHFAPLHIPASLALIRDAASLYPDRPQFACFDTAFHRTLPRVASQFALPAELYQRGILRYGFHGLSYEAIVSILGSDLRPRTVIAHLGNGSSLAALDAGVSVDTSMGLTPTGGIPMSTRSGDLDPGIVVHLLRNRKLDADRLERLLDSESGLAGLSGGRSDLRILEAAAGQGDTQAEMAVEVFCREIRKTIASYGAVLAGLDLLVFTGGIGENSASVRASACRGLSFMGIALDERANREHRETISRSDSPVCVRVIPTDENRQIARHSRRLLSA